MDPSKENRPPRATSTSEELGFQSILSNIDKPTFHNLNETLSPQIVAIDVDVRNPANTSTHDAVIAMVMVKPTQPSSSKKGPADPVRKQKWGKVDTAKYR